MPKRQLLRSTDIFIWTQVFCPIWDVLVSPTWSSQLVQKGVCHSCALCTVWHPRRITQGTPSGHSLDEDIQIKFTFPLFAGFVPCNNLYTAATTGKPQVPFQPWGPISSSVYVYFYHQYIQQPWDGVLLDHQNTTMGDILQIKYSTQREQWDRWMGWNTGGESTARVEDSALHRLKTATVNWGWHGCCCQQYWRLSEQQISPSRYQLTVNKFRLDIRRIRNPQK